MISTIVEGWRVRTSLKDGRYQTEIYSTSDGRLQYSQPTLTATTFYFNQDHLLRLVGLRHIDVCKNVRQFIGFE